MTGLSPLVRGVSMHDADPPLAPFALPLDGPVTAFFGKNGSGKTRLLQALAHAAGAASAPEGAVPYLLHVELVPAGDPQPRGYDLASGLHRALVQHVYVDHLRQTAEQLNQIVQEDWTEPLLEPEQASLEDLVEAVLRAGGATAELASACAAQGAWVLEREQGGYHAAIGLRCNGDTTPLLRDCLLALQQQDVTGPADPYSAARRARLMRSITEVLSALTADEPPWLAHALVRVVVDDGATRPGVELAEVQAATGIVTEDGLDAALQRIGWDLRASLPTSQLTVSPSDNVFLPVDISVTGPAQDHLEELSANATELLRLCLPDGPALQLRLAPPWANRGLVEVVAVDQPTRTVVALDDLSRAQRRWASVAVQLAVHATHHATGRCLLLLDEPDADLHPVARRQVARGLGELAERLLAVCVITTHASEFLSIPDTKLYHVIRDTEGARALPLRTEDLVALDAARAASEMGLTRGDLLSLVRAFVVVEGEHDAALLRTWLSEELSAAQAVVVPVRGTAHLNTIIDCQMLLTYTTADIVIVVDRARDALRAAWEDAMSGPATQRAKRLASARKRIHKGARETAEENKLWELMNAAASSGAVRRLHFHPLSKPDVIEYLPAHLVTGRTGDSWPDLVKAWGHKGDFKTWLRQRGAVISSSRLAYLASDLPAHAEFRALGAAIARHVQKGLKRTV